MSILIISSHPNLTQSVANQTILNQLKKLLPTAEFVYLDTQYPDFRIDVAAEQNRLMQADTIVLQFPFYWYSYPALLKKRHIGQNSWSFCTLCLYRTK
ncbi:NAD(P)H-dependent oxidoreductase [Gallibacterium anatis]|uniref:NAD(P)H-dependent oxidoreductase n=1 Tax=Gallibacterium anatis TaxID=750 RepID=UPI000AFC2078|nr:NAD(P)H-dependent oxidoreductase [Gallibacterium anatis]